MESASLSQPLPSYSSPAASRTLPTHVLEVDDGNSHDAPSRSNRRSGAGLARLRDRVEDRISRRPVLSSPRPVVDTNPTADGPRGPYAQLDSAERHGGGVRHRPVGWWGHFAHWWRELLSFDSPYRSSGSVLRAKAYRKKLITLVASAAFLIVVLAVFLAFSVANSNLGQELYILLIFMLLILSIVFFHSLIRFFMAIGRGSQLTGNHIPHNVGPSGYAQPERPIPVVLAGDEELLAESHRSAQEKVPPPPPAYGLWRSSVRINPDLLYWQRVEERARSSKKADRASRGAHKTTAPRPPSYTSDDGVDYVVDAQPRSLAQQPGPEDTVRH
ncbi:hypothetical protein P168DRAFT_285314 [Aspergillus campestris IBT 28561]|uniref:Uncharacterized protein n=1 Tax=Aspergillus campestris (strain IBT 28561) TaxID=1392248 RepID=A0A2I1CSN7_ASPC2|nr:uncharacterized protein P168DRAFT_285314 [Aspergillus campestris IBT 28561]PKY00642.1 hypothetical protein P168DRAFT_285314 [Aspergillus campestris IBT 28561]